MRNTRTVIASAITCALVLGVTGVAAGNEGGHGTGHNHDTSSPSATTPEVALADSCDDAPLADLLLHNGFQPGVGTTDVDPRCVDTQFGAVSAFENNPTLLIVKSPLIVRKGQDIVIKVSTRNLVRDRFLGAAAGGYYIESATLNGAGLTRGHFHTGCRLLDRSGDAPEPFRLGAQFVATEDGGGSADPDTVTVRIPGFDKRGIAQCVAWAGDGSHRTPMMSFANVIPAVDSVRVIVR